MCTLSWEFGTPGYTVFFNRDELKSRKLAETIRIDTGSDGIRTIHPVDGEKKGSWIVVNEYGLTSCLLNLYEHVPPATPEDGFESRGWLVMQLANARSWEETLAFLSGIDPVKFPPFHLFQFDPNLGVWSMKWSGKEVGFMQYPERCNRPVSGSSFQNDTVVTYRKKVFRDLVVSQETDGRLAQLEQFHHHWISDHSAYSVNMMRPDAQTMSYSRIDVTENRVQFQYADRGLDQVEFHQTVHLTLPRMAITHP